MLTTRGGLTSHAAVVARGMGRACVAGAGSIDVDAEARTMASGGLTLREGEVVTLDGSTGAVFIGQVGMIEPALSDDFATLMGWADGIRRLGVRADAGSMADVRAALRLGADGIGLYRTEPMFVDDEEIEFEERAVLQRGAFARLFATVGERPVAIRLLDPSLHEAGPDRLAAIHAMQVRAILQGACEAGGRGRPARCGPRSWFRPSRTSGPSWWCATTRSGF